MSCASIVASTGKTGGYLETWQLDQWSSQAADGCFVEIQSCMHICRLMSGEAYCWLPDWRAVFKAIIPGAGKLTCGNSSRQKEKVHTLQSSGNLFKQLQNSHMIWHCRFIEEDGADSLWLQFQAWHGTTDALASSLSLWDCAFLGWESPALHCKRCWRSFRAPKFEALVGRTVGLVEAFPPGCWRPRA